MAKPGLFWFIFCSLHMTNIAQILKMKKCRWCTWDSNPGRQDGRRRQIRWAMAAPLRCIITKLESHWPETCQWFICNWWSLRIFNFGFCSRCYKTFFGGNLDFHKIKKLNKVSFNDWNFTKCENNAILKQNYTQKLFISFKRSYSCCFGLRGNLEFPDFLQKKFYNINYRCWCHKTFFEEF